LSGPAHPYQRNVEQVTLLVEGVEGIAQPVTDAELTAAYRANALFDRPPSLGIEHHGSRDVLAVRSQPLSADCGHAKRF
jgi:hypothetical protein